MRRRGLTADVPIRCGEDCPHAVLTEAAVRHARMAVYKGQATIKGLARSDGVCLKTMRQAVTYVTWKHVP